MSKTVTIDRERFERLRRGAEHGYNACMSKHDGWMCVYPEIRESDLDPVETDPDESRFEWLASRDMCLAWHAEDDALDCAASPVEIAFWQQVFRDFTKRWRVQPKPEIVP